MIRQFMTLSFVSSTLALSANLTTPKMMSIPGGTFSRGCTGCDMQDALPVHKVTVSSFKMDETPVTNEAFARFVKATKYVTIAETPPRKEDFPGVPEDKLVAGSAVFTVPKVFQGFRNYLSWWRYQQKANWQYPQGPGGPKALPHHPAVHISYNDAHRYCRWRGARLPTEAEYEYAARGGMEGKKYPWGDSLSHKKGNWPANIWQGKFPMQNSQEDGYAGTSPVKAFPANGYGLYDMGGNIWHWTSDWYQPNHYSHLAELKEPIKDPKGPSSSHDPMEPGLPKKVQKGGSYLCSTAYCNRYYVGSRGKGDINSSSDNLGFRCVTST